MSAEWTASAATVGLLLVAIASFAIAWWSGIFTRKTEGERRTPQIGYATYLLPDDQSRKTLLPPEQQAAVERFRLKAMRRDPADWQSYPSQKHSVWVDNGGLGPAVRVTIPYDLTVYDVDDDGIRRLDDLATHHGTFEIIHIAAGAQRYSDYVIDTTYYPFYRLELAEPVIIGLDGKDCSSRFTDAGLRFRELEIDNVPVWDAWRRIVWGPSKPSSVELVFHALPRRETQTVVVPVTASAKAANGTVIAWSMTIMLTSPEGSVMGPFQVQSGLPAELRIGASSAGEYVLNVWAQQAQATARVIVP
jgi:hypothetical protein